MITVDYASARRLVPETAQVRAITRAMGGVEKFASRMWSLAEMDAAGVRMIDLVTVVSGAARHDADVRQGLKVWMADCAERAEPVYRAEAQNHIITQGVTIARQVALGRLGQWHQECSAWQVCDALSDRRLSRRGRCAVSACRLALEGLVAWDTSAAARYAVAGDDVPKRDSEARWQREHLLRLVAAN